MSDWKELAMLCEEAIAVLEDADAQNHLGLGITKGLAERIELVSRSFTPPLKVFAFRFDAMGLGRAFIKLARASVATRPELAAELENRLRDPYHAFTYGARDCCFTVYDSFGSSWDRVLWQADEDQFQILSSHESYQGMRHTCIRAFRSWVRHCTRMAEKEVTDFVGPRSPAEWGRIFGVTWETVKRRIDEGTVRAKMITTKSWLIHREDVPKPS